MLSAPEQRMVCELMPLYLSQMAKGPSRASKCQETHMSYVLCSQIGRVSFCLMLYKRCFYVGAISAFRLICLDVYR